MKIIIEIDVDNDAFHLSEEKEILGVRKRDLKVAQRILANVGNMINDDYLSNKNLYLPYSFNGSFKLVDDEGRVLS